MGEIENKIEEADQKNHSDRRRAAEIQADIDDLAIYNANRIHEEAMRLAKAARQEEQKTR